MTSPWLVQEEALHTGRIVGDGEGRLDVAALQLEGGLAASQGHRVRLDVSQLPDFRIFPGQARPGLSCCRLFPQACVARGAAACEYVLFHFALGCSMPGAQLERRRAA